MARKRNPIYTWLIRNVSIGFAKLMGVLPLPLARAVGRGIGLIAYHLVPRVRKVGMANLDLAYGDTLSRAEKAKILRDACLNMGIVASEFTRTALFGQKIFPAPIRVKGVEHVDQSRGAVLVGAHLGNWEWLAAGMVAVGPLRGAEIVRPLDDPAMNAFVDNIRTTGGVVTIERDGAGTEMMRWLKEGYCIGILVDQSPRENAVPVTFFGQPCWATIAPVMAALRGKVPVHPVSVGRDDDGGYTIELFPALEFQKTGDLLRDLVENTQLCQDAMESIIRRNPGQWLWMHRRWKRRERLEREWADRQARQNRRKGAADSGEE